MASDGDFFRRLFERLPESNQNSQEENYEQFAEWLDAQDESAQEFIDRSQKERKKKKKKKD